MSEKLIQFQQLKSGILPATTLPKRRQSGHTKKI